MLCGSGDFGGVQCTSETHEHSRDIPQAVYSQEKQIVTTKNKKDSKYGCAESLIFLFFVSFVNFVVQILGCDFAVLCRGEELTRGVSCRNATISATDVCWIVGSGDVSAGECRWTLVYRLSVRV